MAKHAIVLFCYLLLLFKVSLLKPCVCVLTMDWTFLLRHIFLAARSKYNFNTFRSPHVTVATHTVAAVARSWATVATTSSVRDPEPSSNCWPVGR